MSKFSPEVDAYIDAAPEHAQTILKKLRTIMHKASPDLEEHIKWGVPSFEYKGIVAGMAAFKEHVGFGFMKSALMSDPAGLLRGVACESIMHLRFEKLSDLPTQKVLLPYIREAIDLNERGIKVPRKKSAQKSPKVPADLTTALKKSRKAQEVFKNFSPSNQREYIEWLEEAKREATREKRLTTAIEWIAEGKPRNWKYMKKW